MSYVKRLASEIIKSGLLLPVPIASFVDGKALPLAYSVREKLAEWCAARGYSAEKQEDLANIVRSIARHDRYLKAVAFEGAERVGLDGEVEGPVSDDDRDNAAKVLDTRKCRKKVIKADKIALPLSDAPAPLPTLSLPTVRPPAPLIVSTRPRLATSAIQARPPPAAARAPSSPRASVPSAGAVLPTLIVREAVERIENRRGSTRLIRAYLKSGNLPAIASERNAWVADATKLLVADGHDRAAAVHQAGDMVNYMLIGIVPKNART